MEALQYVVKAGKACYISASLMRARQFSKMQYLARLLGWTRFVSMQGQYSLVAARRNGRCSRCWPAVRRCRWALEVALDTVLDRAEFPVTAS
jgi:aryl-alcohol dehydrogenase-like predicted oxidoreductase